MIRFSRPVSKGSTVASWGGQADPLPDLGALRPDVEPRHGGFSLVGIGQGGEDADRGGLARTVGPEDRGDGAGGDLEVDAVEGDCRPVALDQAARFHGVAVGHRCSRGTGGASRLTLTAEVNLKSTPRDVALVTRSSAAGLARQTDRSGTR
jgi:hypothetical protein